MLAVTNKFFEELTAYLEVLALYKCQIVIVGDLNVHLEVNTDHHAIRLLELFHSFDCVQHLGGETHNEGGTLDHVYTRKNDACSEMTVDPAGIISDHSFITWRLSFVYQHAVATRRLIISRKLIIWPCQAASAFDPPQPRTTTSVALNSNTKFL